MKGGQIMVTELDAKLMDIFFKTLSKRWHKINAFIMHLMCIRCHQFYEKREDLKSLENYMFDVTAKYRYCPGNVDVVRRFWELINEEKERA